MPKGETSSRRILIQKPLKGNMVLQFWVKGGSGWQQLPAQQSDRYFKGHISHINTIDLVSTVNFSKIMKLENKKFVIQVSIASFTEHRFMNITKTTTEDFTLFASKKRQGVAGKKFDTGTIIVTVVIGVLIVAAIAALATYFAMRRWRNTFSSSTIQTETPSFQSEITARSASKPAK